MRSTLEEGGSTTFSDNTAYATLPVASSFARCAYLAPNLREQYRNLGNIYIMPKIINILVLLFVNFS